MQMDNMCFLEFEDKLTTGASVWINLREIEAVGIHNGDTIVRTISGSMYPVDRSVQQVAQSIALALQAGL